MSIPPYFLAQNLIHPRIRHGFFGRNGGIGQGVLASLNTGFRLQEDPLITLYHRALIAQTLGFSLSSLCLVEQTHGTKVETVLSPLPRPLAVADALVTSTSGCLLGIFTADCAPILLADVRHGVIGAAHGGWRSALGGIVPLVLKSMENLGATPETTVAAIGPCIHQSSYAVDISFYDRFCAVNGLYARFFIHDSNGYRFDLPAFLQWQCMALGIDTTVLPYDTCARMQDFFSHRRSTLSGERVRGNQLSVIGLL